MKRSYTDELLAWVPAAIAENKRYWAARAAEKAAPTPAPQGYVTLAQRGLVDRGHVDHRGYPMYAHAGAIVRDASPRAAVLRMGVDNSYHPVSASGVLHQCVDDMATAKATVARRSPKSQRKLLAQLRADGQAAMGAMAATL
jgi:hypothetical protein